MLEFEQAARKRDVTRLRVELHAGRRTPADRLTAPGTIEIG